MSKIKETITALASGESLGGVRINRKEQEPLSDERFEIIAKHASRAVIVIAATILVLNAGKEKVIALVVLAVLVTRMYLCLKS